MESFAFKAATPFGKVVEGARQAPSRAALIEELRQGGLVPIRIATTAETAAAWLPWKAGAKRLPAKDLVLLMRELSALFAAGISAERAIAIAARTMTRPRLKAGLERLHELIRGGTPFAIAAREALPGLPPSASSLIEAGEATARLPEAIEQVSKVLSDALAFKQSLTSALIYPAILLATSFGAVAFLLSFVVPQFKTAFAESGAGLPMSTEILIAIGDGFAAFGPYVLLGAVAGGAALMRWRATPAGRYATDAAMLRTPILRDFILRLELARFARITGSLLAAHVPLVRTLKLAESSATNVVLGAALKAAGERAKQGERLAPAMAAHAPWPAEAIEIIGIGEEAGRLDIMLNHLADLYEGGLKRRSERLLSLMTPILTLTMAGVVAAIIGAILSAILGAYDLPL